MKWVSRTLIWIWMTALLVSTVGVSVQKIYCYCAAQTSAGILFVEDSCHARAVERLKDCCLTHAKPIAKSCCDIRKSESGSDCTRKTAQFFQLKSDFLAEQKADFPDLSALMAMNFPVPVVIVTEPVPVKRACLPLLPQPPPRSGRTICIWEQQFLC